MFTWGRRMSKKFELLRRNDNRKVQENDLVRKQSDDQLSGRSMFSLKSAPKASIEIMATPPSPTIINNYSFKTFFHRIGSTGMLSRNNQNSAKQLIDTRTLYRSSSTSQLNSPSYVKGDDPTEGININLCNRTNTIEVETNTVNNYVNEIYLNDKAPVKAASYDDIVHIGNETQTTKRSHFPYAFLRSKLSVLPEENGGSVINHKRILQEMQLLDHRTMNSKAQPVIDSEPSEQHEQLQHQIRDEMVKSSDINPAKLTPNENSNSDSQSQSPRFSNQRLSSCFSSNESGYDSDSRHTEKPNGIKVTTPKGEINLEKFNAMLKPQLCIRERYKHVKLQRKFPNDIIGVKITPIDTENNHEYRYIVTKLLSTGLAVADGRISIGDEVINVNCINLRGMKSFNKNDASENVQEILSTFVEDSVELVITQDKPTTHGNRLNDRNIEPKTGLHIGKYLIIFSFLKC